MDVNGVPMHLVLTQDEWRVSSSDGLTWTDRGGGVTCVGRWPEPTDGDGAPVSEVRHAEVDAHGRVLWIDPDRDVLVRTVVAADRHEILLPTGPWHDPVRLEDVPVDRRGRMGLVGLALDDGIVAVGRSSRRDVAVRVDGAPWRVVDIDADDDLAITDLAWGHDGLLHVLLTSEWAAEIGRGPVRDGAEARPVDRATSGG